MDDDERDYKQIKRMLTNESENRNKKINDIPKSKKKPMSSNELRRAHSAQVFLKR